MPTCSIYNHRGEQLRQFDTDEPGMGGTITIGRSSQCTISLKGEVDRRVGRIHLSLQREGKVWTVSNCSSTSLYLDEQEITASRLDEGDIVRFGHTFLAFGERGGPSPYELAYIDESGHQERHALWPGRNTIGASSDNTITIKDMGLSRSHARLLVNPHDMYVEDAGSSNGTVLDEKRVKSLTKFEVGSMIRLGKAECHILLKGTPIERGKRKAEVPTTGFGKWIAAAIAVILAVLLAKLFGWL
jgi:pSer/pThr/pTyr-binding forkhead associated (FHA) protein